LLGRAPSALAAGLAISPPQPALNLRVSLSPALAWLLRGSLAFMWLWTAAISALWPQDSGVLALLARCGLVGEVGVAALVASCLLNTSLGLLLLTHIGPRLHAVQCAAVLGYGITAAIGMPELTWDHCGPLVKNLPVLAAALVLWLAVPAVASAPPVREQPRAPKRRQLTAD
jgi:DoxX-like family